MSTDNIKFMRLKPEYVGIGKTHKQYPIPDSIRIAPIMNLAVQDRYTNKIRDLVEGVTFSVQTFIMYSLDNESTSMEYKQRIRNTLTTIQSEYFKTINTNK